MLRENILALKEYVIRNDIMFLRKGQMMIVIIKLERN